MTVLRPIYSKLIKNGGAFASFNRDMYSIFEQVQGSTDCVFDPMAGYGTSMRYCGELGLSSFNIEMNLPSYFWIEFLHPKNHEKLISIIDILLRKETKYPTAATPYSVSNGWFSVESGDLGISFYDLLYSIASKNLKYEAESEHLAIILLLPIVGSIANWTPGNVMVHTKEGGFALLEDFESKARKYLSEMKSKLIKNHKAYKHSDHEVVNANSINIDLGEKRFSTMITSPPYPNGLDYSRAFGPEDAFLKLLYSNGSISHDYLRKSELIGSPSIKQDKANGDIEFEELKSLSAIQFIKKLKSFKGSKKAVRDMDIYYIPYFVNYFLKLESAYTNIAKYLSPTFTGFIQVSNNTARNHIVPVAQSVQDIWISLGFDATIPEEYLEEKFHVGSINPRARGLRAKHMEYIVKVKRNG